MDRYKNKKVKYGYIGLFQTNITTYVLSFSWLFIHNKLHPYTEFAFNLLKGLFFIRFYTWDEKPKGYFSIAFLWLPSLNFRIGNGSTWLWFRNENWNNYKIDLHNRKFNDNLFE